MLVVVRGRYQRKLDIARYDVNHYRSGCVSLSDELRSTGRLPRCGGSGTEGQVLLEPAPVKKGVLC